MRVLLRQNRQRKRRQLAASILGRSGPSVRGVCQVRDGACESGGVVVKKRSTLFKKFKD